MISISLLAFFIVYVHHFIYIWVIDENNYSNILVKNKQKWSIDNDIFWIQDIIILYDHNTYFLSSPVCQTCLFDLYRKMTDQFRPELFDDSVYSIFE